MDKSKYESVINGKRRILNTVDFSERIQSAHVELSGIWNELRRSGNIPTRAVKEQAQKAIDQMDGILEDITNLLWRE